MKPNAPPPQLVMSPVFWPSARILKKHWATSSISSAIASALLSTIGPAPVLRPTSVLCRADHWIIGGSLVLIGVALATAGIRNFSRAGTPVRSIKPTRALVTTGIHGWTRNPIYLGMFLLYGGIAVAAQSPWILIFTLPLAITIRYGVVAREEAYLERRFGDAYRDYKVRVRRWV